ncbi:unnamed protein product, partial [Rotaria magnacalcarata]
MIKGRKALHDYEEDITPNIFRKQINDDSCELLETLKCYVEQQWKTMIPDQWFHRFLEQQISESRESYNKILTRAAEYGSKFTKDNGLLSLIIQFLFEFDDDNIENTDVFNQLWNSLICEGLQGIRHYEDFIAPNVLQQQLQNDQSPLHLALLDYFSEELKNFLQQKEININRPEIFKIALDFIQKYNEFIKAGFPFEIVDGDNFYFPYSFLFEALKPFCNHRTLVISVIGPQNSGKSTLLNYMFGTLFDVRDGRCTRGIYGSFVKTNRTDFEYILLIDTEGLLSIGREDPEFDRRIVLFCLAVSHIVLVNMVGEVSTTLQSMLTLCTDSLEKMGADLNIENNRAAIDRIISDLKKFGLGESIDIRKETFHTLPSAYKKEGQTLISNAKLPKAVKTAPEFIECVQSLCGEIIHSAESYLDRVKECLDPLQWLSSSKTIFDTLQKFSDLTYYQDIYERRLDDEIREHIRNDLTKIFSADFRDGLIIESSHKTEQEIHELFLSKQNKIQETARENLRALFKLLKVPDTLRRRTEQFLSVQIIEMFNALQTSTIAVNERERVKLIVRNGEGDLQKLIQDVIQSGQQMSIQEASTQFNRMF